MGKKRKSEPDLAEVQVSSFPQYPGHEGEVGGTSSPPDKKKKKQSNQQRIGQACDRCRIRKLTCDPGIVCAYCAKAGVQCTTTDRLSGRTYPRGELQRLERNATDQITNIRVLEARLRSLGEEVQPYEEPYPTTAHLFGTPSATLGDRGNSEIWEAEGRIDSVPPAIPSSLYISQTAGSPVLPLPDLRSGLADKYLGISTSPSNSSAHGAKLNLLGWELSINHFTPDASDEINNGSSQHHNRSYKSFVASAFGGSRVKAPEMPPKKEAVEYAQVFLQMLGAFTPILHKPTFMTLLSRFCDNPKAHGTSAEKVLVHIMLANVLYQNAIRNWEDPTKQQKLQSRSNHHYHYSLNLIADLMTGHTLQDVQALVMICVHVRNFPNPEISWTLANITLNKAIEINLHKSASRLVSKEGHKNMLEVEMRKRIFWTIMCVSIAINGKLGRPMPIRMQDFDIELPEPVDDNLLSEAGLDTSRSGTCDFLVGIEAFKLEPIFLELYNEMHSLNRSPSNYIEFTNHAEKRIKKWSEQICPDLKEKSKTEDPKREIFIRFLDLWALEFRLVLLHPSLSLTMSAKFNERSLKTCMQICREMMGIVQYLQRVRCMDTTWYNCALYLLAIQTTMYGYNQLPDLLTEDGLKDLRSDMEIWLSIMGDIGNLLGTGTLLRETLRTQIDNSMTLLQNQLKSNASRALSAANRRASIADVTTSHEPPIQSDNAFNNPSTFKAYEPWSQNQNLTDHSNDFTGSNTVFQTSNPYQMTTQYNYSDPTSGNTYAMPPLSYVPPSYPIHLTHAIPSPYPHQTMANSPISYADATAYGAGPQSWGQYIQALPNSLGPQDYNHANALLQLGGRAQVSKDDGSGGALDAGVDGGGPQGGGQAWPSWNLSYGNVH